MAQPSTGPLPGNVAFGTVTGRFLTAVADSPADTDRDPEGLPATDLRITFSPSIVPAVVRDASSTPPTIFALADVAATVGPTGDLLGPDGQPGIRLVASTGPALDPTGWTWKVTLASQSFPTMSFSFALDPGQTVELASVVQVPASPGATLAAWLQAVADTRAARDQAVAAAAGGGGPRRLPAYVQSTASNVYDPQRNLYNYKAANTRRIRAAVGRGMAYGQPGCDILVVGDSTSDNFAGAFLGQYMWPKTVYDMLANPGPNAFLPNGGTGFVYCPRSNTASQIDVRWTFTGTWNDAGSYRSTDTSGATATFANNGGGNAWTAQAGTEAHLWYYGTSGPFTVSVDGAPPVTVSPSGGLTVQHYAVTGLPYGDHSVKVTTTSTATVYLIGAAVQQPYGLKIHNSARFGETAQDYASTAVPGLTAPVASIVSPDLVLVALGVNDLMGAGRTPAQAAGDVSTVATFWKGRGADVVLVAGYEPSPTAAWGAFAAAQYAVADALDVPLIDLYDRSGGYAVASSNGLMADTYHPSIPAQKDWGRAVASIIRDL